MRREHKPAYLWRLRPRFDDFYARRFLHPQFEAVGEGCSFANPFFVNVLGSPITLGKHVHVSAMIDNQVRLAVWPVRPGEGSLHIGDYTVINPGVRISAGVRIELGKNVILASNVYITDADWHGRYDRVFSVGGHAAVVIEDNVWLSEGVIVGRGVTIGKNSIVGAGAIVVHDIPENSIAAGNPARVVRQLDPNERFVSRSDALGDGTRYYADMKKLEDELLAPNTLRDWLRHLISPTRED